MPLTDSTASTAITIDTLGTKLEEVISAIEELSVAVTDLKDQNDEIIDKLHDIERDCAFASGI